jgi:hypothetical protein
MILGLAVLSSFIENSPMPPRQRFYYAILHLSGMRAMGGKRL